MQTNALVRFRRCPHGLLAIVRISWPGSVLFRSRAFPAETPLAVAYEEAVHFAARRAKGRALVQGWLG